MKGKSVDTAKDKIYIYQKLRELTDIGLWEKSSFTHTILFSLGCKESYIWMWMEVIESSIYMSKIYVNAMKGK